MKKQSLWNHNELNSAINFLATSRTCRTISLLLTLRCSHRRSQDNQPDFTRALGSMPFAAISAAIKSLSTSTNSSSLSLS